MWWWVSIWHILGLYYYGIYTTTWQYWVASINKMAHTLIDFIISTNSTQNTHLHLYPVHTPVDPASFDTQPPASSSGPAFGTSECYYQSPLVGRHWCLVEFSSTKETHPFWYVTAETNEVRIHNCTLSSYYNTGCIMVTQAHTQMTVMESTHNHWHHICSNVSLMI